MTAEVIENGQELSFFAKLGFQLKENRVEAMIVTILLYSTGMLDKAWTYGAGVCS